MQFVCDLKFNKAFLIFFLISIIQVAHSQEHGSSKQGIQSHEDVSKSQKHGSSNHGTQSIDQSHEDKTRKLKNIAFVCAGLPWVYGPYQLQGEQLMSSLSKDYGFKTHWMMRGSSGEDIPQGIYSAKEISALTPKSIPPIPRGWKTKHLKFLGLPNRTALTDNVARVNSQAISISTLNDAARIYDIEAFIVLGDINVVYLDSYDFDVPVIAWVPFHYNDVRGSNRALLKPYTHIVGLAPSTTQVIKDVREDVTYIPHIIDGKVLELSAESWLASERQLRGNEIKSDREIVFNAHKYDKMFKRRPANFSAVETKIHIQDDSTGSEKQDDDVFLVLASGTNYEDADRKGWDIAIQAFAKFHEMFPDIKKHLWVHSFTSQQLNRDHDGKGNLAPPELETRGVDLRLLVQSMDLPPDLYTVDIDLHPRGRVAAMKLLADVCLHPSKVEGFGMNVLECQSVGTPVVTTKFRAMDDFTKNGIAVPPAQWEHYPSFGGKWAMPDVKGVAKALGVIATNRNSDEWIQKSKDAMEWIRGEFSVTRVVQGFNSVLKDVVKTHSQKLPYMFSKMDTVPSFHERPMFHVTRDLYPKMVDWDEDWMLYHRPDVRVDYDMVQRVLHNMVSNNVGMIALAFIQCKDTGGVPIEFQASEREYDGIHRFKTEHPILVPTWAFGQVQQRFPYIHNSVLTLLGNTDQQFVKIFPPGPAQVVESNKKKSEHQDKDEL